MGNKAEDDIERRTKEAWERWRKVRAAEEEAAARRRTGPLGCVAPIIGVLALAVALMAIAW